jgi:hypothetical protein
MLEAKTIYIVIGRVVLLLLLLGTIMRQLT